jgi:hypothetical protein
MNPYESPLSDSDPPSRKSAEPPVRGGLLVYASLILAFLTIMPAIDFLAIDRAKGFGSLHVLKDMAFCLAIPIVPLVIYLCLYGWRGLIAAKLRILIIGVIVGLIVAANMHCIMR